MAGRRSTTSSSRETLSSLKNKAEQAASVLAPAVGAKSASIMRLYISLSWAEVSSLRMELATEQNKNDKVKSLLLASAQRLFELDEKSELAEEAMLLLLETKMKQ